MACPLSIAKRLLEGETIPMNFDNKNQKHDFDYEVLKKLLDLTNNDMQKASRTLVRLKSRPID